MAIDRGRLLVPCAPRRLVEQGNPARVDRAERPLLFGVVEHQPAPVLRIGARRCLLGEADAVEDHAALDRSVVVEAAPDGARRREQPVDRLEIEGVSLCPFPDFVGQFGGLPCWLVPQPFARLEQLRRHRTGRSFDMAIARKAPRILTRRGVSSQGGSYRRAAPKSHDPAGGFSIRDVPTSIRCHSRCLRVQRAFLRAAATAAVTGAARPLGPVLRAGRDRLWVGRRWGG